MKWYWWAGIILAILVIITILINILYSIEVKENRIQLNTYFSEINNYNTQNEIYNYSIDSCNESNSRMSGELIGLAGLGKLLDLNLNSEELVENFKIEMCACLDSKGFNLVDFFNSVKAVEIDKICK